MIELGGVAKFEIFRDTSERFRFRLMSEDGEISFVSQDSYPTKEDCIEHIELYKQLVHGATIEDRIERAQCLMSELKADEFLLKVGQLVALGEDIIAQKARDETIVLYEVVK